MFKNEFNLKNCFNTRIKRSLCVQKYVALQVFSEMQQSSLENEREELKTMKNKLKDMLRWLMKREEKYKVSVDSLERQNEQLHCALATTQREYERDRLLNNDKGKKYFSSFNFSIFMTLCVHK